MDPVEAATQMAEAAVWERLGSTGRLEDVETFMRLYPTSYLAPTAQRRRDDLMAQQRAASQPAAPAQQGPAQAPPLRIAGTPPPPEQPKPPEKLASLQPVAPPSDASAQQRRDLAMALPPVAPAPPTSTDHVFQDCDTCPSMVRVPPGTLMMGQGAKDPSATPVHKVTLRAFALSQYPVTIGNWNACHTDGGCGPPPEWPGRRTTRRFTMSAGTIRRLLSPGCRAAPDTHTACRPKLNGSMRRVPAPQPVIGGATAGNGVGQLHRLRWQAGSTRAAAGRRLPAQPLRSPRHARGCCPMDAGLLVPQLQ